MGLQEELNTKSEWDGREVRAPPLVRLDLADVVTVPVGSRFLFSSEYFISPKWCWLLRLLVWLLYTVPASGTGFVRQSTVLGVWIYLGSQWRVHTPDATKSFITERKRPHLIFIWYESHVTIQTLQLRRRRDLNFLPTGINCKSLHLLQTFKILTTNTVKVEMCTTSSRLMLCV